MGGGAGGAIRAAAKVAGIGVANSGLRGGASVALPAEQSVMRGASRPTSAMISSSAVVTEEVPPKSSWVMVDDWDFAGGVEEVPLVNSSCGRAEWMPRLVFGGPPSLEEAKSATNDLKDALEKVYASSPNSISHGDSPEAGKVSGVALLSNSEYLETKDCISLDSKTVAVPKSTIQAFTFLCESPAAQTVVASIASDQNVWNAVLENPALRDFLKSHKTYHEAEDQQSNKMMDQLPDESIQSENTGNAFSEILDNIKVAVAEMVDNVSGFVQRVLHFGSVENMSTDSKESASSDFTFGKMGASFMALAIMVIMVVVLKRH